MYPIGVYLHIYIDSEVTPSFALMDIQGSVIVTYVYQLVDGEVCLLILARCLQSLFAIPRSRSTRSNTVNLTLHQRFNLNPFDQKLLQGGR